MAGRSASRSALKSAPGASAKTASGSAEAPSTVEIPDRLYFKIGDVARICGVEPYVLRFWETQFPALKPNKGGTGQRLYRRREVELAVRIKQLVHGEGYTLAGARQAIEAAPRTRPAKQQGVLPLTGEQAQKKLDAAAAAIGRARAELRDLVRQLTVETPTIHERKARISSLRQRGEPLFPA